jgi:hypothetical protein
LIRWIGLVFDLLQLRLAGLCIMIELKDAGTQTAQLRIGQRTLLIEIHSYQAQFVHQLTTLLHELIDLGLFATET